MSGARLQELQQQLERLHHQSRQLLTPALRHAACAASWASLGSLPAEAALEVYLVHCWLSGCSLCLHVQKCQCWGGHLPAPSSKLCHRQCNSSACLQGEPLPAKLLNNTAVLTMRAGNPDAALALLEEAFQVLASLACARCLRAWTGAARLCARAPRLPACTLYLASTVLAARYRQRAELWLPAGSAE